VLLSVPGSHLVDCLDSLLCLWFFHRVIESGGNLLPFAGPLGSLGVENGGYDSPFACAEIPSGESLARHDLS
jgi:hypothetical protein